MTSAADEISRRKWLNRWRHRSRTEASFEPNWPSKWLLLEAHFKNLSEFQSKKKFQMSKLKFCCPFERIIFELRKMIKWYFWQANREVRRWWWSIAVKNKFEYFSRSASSSELLGGFMRLKLSCSKFCCCLFGTDPFVHARDDFFRWRIERFLDFFIAMPFKFWSKFAADN